MGSLEAVSCCRVVLIVRLHQVSVQNVILLVFNDPFASLKAVEMHSEPDREGAAV